MKKLTTKKIVALTLVAAVLVPTLNFEKANAANSTVPGKMVAKVRSHKLGSQITEASTPTVVAVAGAVAAVAGAVGAVSASVVATVAAVKATEGFSSLQAPNSSETKLSMLD
jgi:hypothetical protein